VLGQGGVKPQSIKQIKKGVQKTGIKKRGVQGKGKGRGEGYETDIHFAATGKALDIKTQIGRKRSRKIHSSTQRKTDTEHKRNGRQST